MNENIRTLTHPKSRSAKRKKRVNEWNQKREYIICLIKLLYTHM